METSYVVCFHFRFNIFAFTELWSRGLRLAGRGNAAKERKEERGDDGGNKRREEVRLEGLK